MLERERRRSRLPVEPPTERGRRTRHALLRAAETVFGKKGFDRASISDITRRARVAQGTFYVHFHDKQAVFLELVSSLGAGLRDAIRTAVAGLDQRLDIERAGFRAFFGYCAEHPNLYRIVRQAEFVDEAAYRAYYRGMARAYAAGLTRAMDRRQIRRLDPERLAYSLMGIADFLGMRWVLWEKTKDVDVEALVEHAMALVTSGIAKR